MIGKKKKDLGVIRKMRQQNHQEKKTENHAQKKIDKAI